jgi:hypothetical protein
MLLAIRPSATLPQSELERLRDELREDEDGRRWMERVAPWLLRAFGDLGARAPDAASEPAG